MSFRAVCGQSWCDYYSTLTPINVQRVHTKSYARQERTEEELTLLVVDGNRQEGDEGHNCQK